MPLKIVVTGAMGHIGSYVVRDLACQFPKAEIVMIDNLLTQRFSSLFDLPETGCYRFMEVDVTSAEVRPLLQDTHVVIHLAAITDAAASFEREEQVEANNYVATMNVARACAETGASFIGVSSTSVYGTQNAIVSEECSLDDLKPQSPYAQTKLKEEELITKLCAEKGLKGIMFRFGTIFGASPGMRFHTAVNKFCWQAVMGVPLTVWKTAYDQRRPYLDLGDAVRAVAFIIERGLFDGRVYNVVTANATVCDVVNCIRTHVPEVHVEFVETEIMNQLSYDVANTRMTRAGFEVRGDLGKGVAETIALLKNANAG